MADAQPNSFSLPEDGTFKPDKFLPLITLFARQIAMELTETPTPVNENEPPDHAEN